MSVTNGYIARSYPHYSYETEAEPLAALIARRYSQFLESHIWRYLGNATITKHEAQPSFPRLQKKERRKNNDKANVTYETIDA